MLQILSLLSVIDFLSVSGIQALIAGGKLAGWFGLGGEGELDPSPTSLICAFH